MTNEDAVSRLPSEFVARFPDDEACLRHVWRERYSADGEHAVCPRCEDVRLFRRYATAPPRKSWSCTTCGHHLHPTAGTIFHRSSTSLQLWFYAIWLMERGAIATARDLEYALDVTYKTAWRMRDKIRGAKPITSFGSDRWRAEQAATVEDEIAANDELATLVAEQARDAKTFQVAKPWEHSLFRSPRGHPERRFVDYVSENDDEGVGFVYSPRARHLVARDAEWVPPLIDRVDYDRLCDEIVANGEVAA